MLSPRQNGFSCTAPHRPVFLLYGSIWTRARLSLIMSSGWMSQSLGERNAWCLRERKKQSPEKVPFGARSKFTRLNSIYKHATQGVEASSLITQRHVIMLFVSVKCSSNTRGVITYCITITDVSFPHAHFKKLQHLSSMMKRKELWIMSQPALEWLSLPVPSADAN